MLKLMIAPDILLALREAKAALQDELANGSVSPKTREALSSLLLILPMLQAPGVSEDES